MRTIDFRVWGTVDKKYTHHVCDHHNWYYYYNLPKVYKLEQFTGLHDPAGKEIYEGDIIVQDEVTTEEDLGIITEINTIYGVVVFKDGAFILVRENKEYKIKGMSIGNVNENPELLK